MTKLTLAPKLIMIAKILGLFGLSSCAVPPAPPKSEKLNALSQKKDLSVLFIGNSYSFGVPKALEKIAKENGRNIKTGHSTYGGWHLSQHVAHQPTLRKLRSQKWDLVVIQEQSLLPSLSEWQRRKKMDPAVKLLADEAREIGAIPLLYQTWGRRDGAPGIPKDDFFQMNQRVCQGYRRAAKHAGGVFIVPAGDAWEEVFKRGNGHQLFHPDGSHPSSLGDQVTAKEFFRVICGESLD
jgi:hypothetical protein